MIRRSRILFQDPFSVLGVSRTSSEKEIKDAYLKLAKKYHPDLNKNGEERFKAVKTAYEKILSGEAKSSQEQQKQKQTYQSNQQRAYYGNSRADRVRSPFGFSQGNNTGRAWTQRAEYQRVHEQEVNTRSQAQREITKLANIIFISVLILLTLPIVAQFYAQDEDERRRRQEEYEHLRRQQLMMRPVYEDPYVVIIMKSTRRHIHS